MGRSVWSAALVTMIAATFVVHAGVARSDGSGTDAHDAGLVSDGAVASPAGPATPATEEAGALGPGESNCPLGMVDVEGDYCATLPEQKCIRWVSTPGLRCAEFAPSEECASTTIHKHFCMDRFEYPNLAGEKPLVMKTWTEARALCVSNRKRLCGETEWTLACEGPERLAYPYGRVRDSLACNIDKPPINPHDDELRNYERRDAEAKRLWQGEPSGARARCKSAFGVQDLTGNVDEWVVNEKGKPHRSALKGGYWSWVRGACRPVTDGHDEDFRYYQIGFRCCQDHARADTLPGPS